MLKVRKNHDGTLEERESNTMTKQEAEYYIKNLTLKEKEFLNQTLKSFSAVHPHEQAVQDSTDKDD